VSNHRRNGGKTFRPGDPAKRAARRRAQRESGYRGVKRRHGSRMDNHNKGRMTRDGRSGEVRGKR